MKFTKIQLQGLSTIDLPIANASSSDPYILTSAEGLGPPAIDVFIDQTLDLDGYYKGRQTQYREPVLKIGLNPNYITGVTVADLRTELYGLLSPGSSDSIRLSLFNEDVEVMYTTGYLKRMEIVPFSPTPEVQITMSCLKPFMQAPVGIHVETVPGESVVVANEGSAETGLYFEVQFTTVETDFTITDSRGKSMKIIYAFEVDDILTVDTRSGSRSITVTRDEETTSIIYALSMNSSWLYLYGGNNTLTVDTTNFTWLDFYYVPLYWGI